MTKSDTIKPPAHLRPATRRWWESVTADFVLEPHHLMILTKAAEAWDRSEEAREVLAKEGLTYTDRFNQPRARPETVIERDNRASFAKLVRELGLDLPTDPPRMASVGGKAGK